MDDNVKIESLLSCDRCKKLLDAPIMIQCGMNICAKHVENEKLTFQPCFYCQEDHSPPFNKNLKLTNMINKLHIAAHNRNTLLGQIEKYETLTKQPQEYLSRYFVLLEKEVDFEKNRVKTVLNDMIESKARDYITQLRNIRSNYFNNLNRNFLAAFDINLINEVRMKLQTWAPDLLPDKTSEDKWEKIAQEAKILIDICNRKLNVMISLIKNNKEVVFLKKNLHTSAIDFGTICYRDIDLPATSINSLVHQRPFSNG
jgi:hypothetical protein